MMRHAPPLAALALAALCATSALAAPRPAAPAPPIPAARDIAYPGVIDLKLDVSDVQRRVYRVVQTIPVQPGPLVLSLPKWIPGEHSPSAQISILGGLIITANGQRLEWRRDPVEMTAFHLDIPAGVETIEARLEQQTAQPGGPVRIAVTPDLLVVKWTAVALYPAGYNVDRIRVRPAITLPEGWRMATALDGGVSQDRTTRFAETSFETLMDSPVYAGRNLATFELDPGAKRPVRLNVFADDPASLAASPAQIEIHRNLVRQTDRLFGGARNFDHYDFLFSLNEAIGYLGAEHQRSSENGYHTAGYFTDWDSAYTGRDILAHEYVHAWNGKHRRPADLWTPDYTTPMRNSLLWVYEGLTEYWGDVLATRAGLFSPEQMRQRLALIAANAQATPGRDWRSLRDTTNAYIINAAGGSGATAWVRSLDYYEEGQLVWLDADTLIRERTNGKKSLDDFARSFFGVDDGQMDVSTYTFEDVVAGLNAVLPHDWAGFFNARLDAHDAAPLDGLKRGGWTLTYGDAPTDYFTAYEGVQETALFTHSIGLDLDGEGVVQESLWNGPAFTAGIIAGAQIIAVGDRPYDAQTLRAAIAAAASPGSPPIRLTLKVDGRYRTADLPYHGGLRYPRLDRVAGAPDRLGEILAPRR